MTLLCRTVDYGQANVADGKWSQESAELDPFPNIIHHVDVTSCGYKNDNMCTL